MHNACMLRADWVMTQRKSANYDTNCSNWLRRQSSLIGNTGTSWHLLYRERAFGSPYEKKAISPIWPDVSLQFLFLQDVTEEKYSSWSAGFVSALFFWDYVRTFMPRGIFFFFFFFLFSLFIFLFLTRRKRAKHPSSADRLWDSHFLLVRA